ncbi:MAG: hypothetical protein WD851_20795 [Pirellulales bacterium]
MTQHHLNRLVAAATGESRRTVAGLGFSLADPVTVQHDPEPYDELASYVDWDELDAQRYALCPV